MHYPEIDIFLNFLCSLHERGETVGSMVLSVFSLYCVHLVVTYLHGYKLLPAWMTASITKQNRNDTWLVYTIPTSCAISPTMYALVFVTCVHRRIVLNLEGCAVCDAGCVLHVVVHGVWVVLWVAATCYWVAGMYGLSCMQKLWGFMHEHCWVCVACWSLSCIANRLICM